MSRNIIHIYINVPSSQIIFFLPEMEVACSSEITFQFQWTTQHYILDDCSRNFYIVCKYVSCNKSKICNKPWLFQF
jgi:hypothetical protein